MFQSSRKQMKWSSLLKDIKEKVGLSSNAPHHHHPASPATPSPDAPQLADRPSSLSNADHAAPLPRNKHELELDFKKFWEEFRSSSSEKEKETSLNTAVCVFCKLVKEQSNVDQIIPRLVEGHIFSFVVGRAFVTEIEKLRISSKGHTLDVAKVIIFFSEGTKDGIGPGPHLLQTIEILVSGTIDKQPLLDSGIFSCLILILNALLTAGDSNHGQPINSVEELAPNEKSFDREAGQVRRLEIEGSVVHIMKALASHASAAQCLIEDDSLQLIFQMVANGSSIVFSQFSSGVVPLHTIQLHRHAVQILSLLLVNDNGSTAKYIRKRHLIKVLLMAVKDFNAEKGDSAYTMGIVDLLLECVELSYRPESGSVRLREDIHNAHGYQFLVQFALKLSDLEKDLAVDYTCSLVSIDETRYLDHSSASQVSSVQLSPSLSRLLDVLVNLAQTGPAEPFGGKSSKSTYSKGAGHSRSRTPSADVDEIWEKSNTKVKDLEAIQMLQDIFLKADNQVLQAEVLNRMFKIFSGHIDNYKLCQELRTVPLFILNMSGFPQSLQDIILKILEYAVMVVNCVPEQELLSLCCLLQQPITTSLKQTILAFFVKLLSFDAQYKKTLREVGVLEVLLDDMKQHKFCSGIDQKMRSSSDLERASSSCSLKKHMEDKDLILSSPKLIGPGSGKFSLFDHQDTIAIAWDCLLSLLRKAETNQQTFRSSNGVNIILPFLASDIHRPGVLRLLSCLIMEDAAQVHHEELEALTEILKSGMVTNIFGAQYKLHNDAKCDTFGLLWRILGSNNSAQRVFGEATGFSLLLTTLHSFQGEEENSKVQSCLSSHMKVLCYLLRVISVAVLNNAINRLRLHTIMSSDTFYDLLYESSLICVDSEKQVIQLFLELALETVIQPSSVLQTESTFSSEACEDGSVNFLSCASLDTSRLSRERVCNASAVGVLIRSLLLFTPKVQLDLLKIIEKLALAGSFNQENLTSICCIGHLLETVSPFMVGSSPLLEHALRIVEVLGAYRLSSSELRVIVRFLFQLKAQKSGYLLVDMMEKLIQMQDIRSESVSLAPFVEMDMYKVGNASIQVSLGERTWPPAAGYSFSCWFQFHNFFKNQYKESEYVGSARSGAPLRSLLRIFSVDSMDDSNTAYAELHLQDNGLLTLATSSSCSLSFPGIEFEEGRWHHLAVVHSKPNALAGLFQASVAYVYLDGKLRHTGKLGYSPSPVGKPLQVTLGTSVVHARTTELSWRFRSCYLFEEVLTSGSICFMYILGRGYRGLFQDTDLLRFVPNQAYSGDMMAILGSLDAEFSLTPNTQRLDSASKQGNPKSDSNGAVWDFERLANLALLLYGRRLIFAFDGTSSEAYRVSGTLSLLNLVDPLSAAASPIGGIPRYGRLNGDTYICNQFMIGDCIRTVGGMAVALALVEAAETREMLHMSLNLLACSLNQNSQNLIEMQALRGYHLLALFLHRRMSLFDMRSLDIFFQIAACEASVLDPIKLQVRRSVASVGPPDINLIDFPLPKFVDEASSVGSRGDLDDFSGQKDIFSHLSELENVELREDNSNCIVLSNPDMVEHVLLDWTLWVTSPVSIQITLLGFLERMVSMHRYRNHNLVILRRINLVQHLLVTLQRGDVEVPVLEKLVVLLGVILEDGFLASELELVVRFVIMTFEPPELTARQQVLRESMGKHVIVRNMLLEMLIDLQVTIKSEELLEQWHKIVSSKLITYFLDEAVHPTSMRWIMTLLGVCLASSSTFSLKFRSSGGYQGLARILPSFYDSPEIYYIIFCLMFGKDVYPRLPEVRMLDFHALLPSDGNYDELKFLDLLDSVIAMAKSTFDRLCMQSMIVHQSRTSSHLNGSLVAELVEATIDMSGDLQGEALMHKTYAARLMGGEAAAPAAATSILRFMVDLAKMSSPFSCVCRRTEFLENCVDLYFSCVRAHCAVKMARELLIDVPENVIDTCDNQSTKKAFSNAPDELDMSARTSINIGNFTQELKSTSSEEIIGMQIYALENNEEKVGSLDQLVSTKPSSFDIKDVHISLNENNIGGRSNSDVNYIFRETNGAAYPINRADFQSSASLNTFDSPMFSDKSNSKLVASSLSSVSAFTASLGSTTGNPDTKVQLIATPSIVSSLSVTESDASPNSRTDPQETPTNLFFPINSKLLIEIDDSGYGGGPCSAGATAVLDFLAEVLADAVAEQLKAVQFVEGILESVPLFVNVDAVLVFQGLCLSRMMNFLERRLLRDDEEDEKKLDRNRWSVNLDPFCWMITDRIYMGAFPQPVSVLRTLDFLVSMLQLANKDGHVEEAMPVGKGLLSIARGNRQVEAYVHAILKNTNRVIMFCFLPSFLLSIGEDELASGPGIQRESGEGLHMRIQPEESMADICTILRLLVANKHLIISPINHDTDLVCCLCVNLILLLRDKRQTAQNLSVDVIKYLLLRRRQALEDLLVSKPNQGQNLDVLRGGFDILLTGSSSAFFEWFWISERTINRVLEQCADIMWMQYIAGSMKFPGVRIKGMDARRKREMGRKSRDASKLEMRHWEQINERRYALELVRDLMSTELRVIRQDKYGWVLHAENEWQNNIQQLVHERGIFPLTASEPEWQLCPIEGPYRMRKKLERCKINIETIHNAFTRGIEFKDTLVSRETNEHGFGTSYSDSASSFNAMDDDVDGKCYGDTEYEESFFKDVDVYKVEGSDSAQVGWNDDRCSSVKDPSLHSAMEFGAKSSSFSVQITDDMNMKSDAGSFRQSYSEKADVSDNKAEKEILDNGEYLIRPYLLPLEKIRFKYNCERVVGLDKHDGIFLIGDLCLYIIENFYSDEAGCIHEKENEDELSVIDQALGVKKDLSSSTEFQLRSPLSWTMTTKALVGGRAWAYNGGAWGKEKMCSSGNLPHPWHMWKLDSVHELLKRDYQLRPVAVEIFSMDGCNDLLVFHKREREEVFKNLLAMNLPRNSMLDTTISGTSKQESSEGSRLFKTTAKSFSKRWQNGEISNFQYLMHLNTLAGRGYSDLTQYPVFPWVLADYESEALDLTAPHTFRKLDKPMGCQTADGEEEFKKRYESWDDPDVPKFHYGSHYSSAGIVLFYLVRLPPFSTENQTLQGGQFDHADRLFNSVRDTWLSAAGKGNTSDVKELIPEFFYMPEFLENRFSLNLGEKQSGEKVGDVVLPPWAKGSAREFVRKHREALESDYVSENLHHWIDLIFGYKQRGKAAEVAVNVFYHYTYEGSVDIDSVSDPAMKASILAQINHFGQTPKQLFLKPHGKRRIDRKLPLHPLRHCAHLSPLEVRKISSSICQIVTSHEKVLVAGANSLLKPVTYSKYIRWGFADRSLRIMSYDQDRLLSTHEGLHAGSQIQCTGISHDGHILVTGADDGVVAVWRFGKDGSRIQRQLRLEQALCAHTARIGCLYVSQPYTLIVTGSDDCTVIIWDLTNLAFVKQLPRFPAPVSAIHVNDLTGEILTAAGILLSVWSINGDCLAVVNTSQLPSDLILSVTSAMCSDWQDTNWFVTGHQSGAVKVWNMVHNSSDETSGRRNPSLSEFGGGMGLSAKAPEYKLVLRKVLKAHKHPVTALHLTGDMKMLLSGDSGGHLFSWTLQDESLRTANGHG